MTWVKGQSGNPKGKRTATRDRINEAFLRNILADWRQNGVEAITKARETDPLGYIAIVARLQPKDTQVDVRHGLSPEFLAALRGANQITRGHAGATIDHEPQDAVLIPLIDKDKQT